MTSLKSDNCDDYQDVPSYIGGMARHYGVGASEPPHRHARAQLIFAVSGVMEISTSERHWLVPPQRALWMPADIEHEVLPVRTPVEMRTLYVRTTDVPVRLPRQVMLVNVSPLLRELIVRAVELPIEEKVAGAAAQVVALIFNELSFTSVGDFHLPRVRDPRLARVEAELLADPGDTRSIDELAARAAMSVRTFSRRFQADTTLTFSIWRQQLRLGEAVVRLVNGEAVSTVALSLGYENVGSFSRMFKRAMGATPSELTQSGRDLNLTSH